MKYDMTFVFTYISCLKERENPMENTGSYVVDVLLYVTHETAKSKSPLSLIPANQVCSKSANG